MADSNNGNNQNKKGGLGGIIIFIIIIALIYGFIHNQSKETEIDYEANTHVNKELSSVLNEKGYESLTTEQKKEACKEKLDQLEKDDYVKNVKYQIESMMYEFEYKDGSLGGVMLEKFDKDCNGITKDYADIDASGYVKNVRNQIKYETSGNPYKEKDLKAIFLYGLGTGEGFSKILENIDSRAVVMSAEFLYTNIDRNVTVDEFKTSLQGNAFIAIEEHGSLYDGIPVICTAEEVTNANQKRYSEDLKKGNIVMVNCADENDEVRPYYWIKPKFFTDHYKNKELKGSIVYLGCCKGYYNDKLVSAFGTAGADCVIANTETVYTWYNARIQDAFVYSLLCGDTANDALEFAKSVWGQNDIEFAQKYIVTDEYKTEVASPKIYCGRMKTLVSFESETPAITPTIKDDTISYEQALKEGDLCYKSAYESYWGMIDGQDIIEDTVNYMSYVNVTNIEEIRKRFTQNGFNQFCNYNDIQLINGKYYRLLADRGSNLYYQGHELKLNLSDITSDKITFTSLEKYNDSDWPNQQNRFVIVKENGQWLVDDFTLPD